SGEGGAGLRFLAMSGRRARLRTLRVMAPESSSQVTVLTEEEAARGWVFTVESSAPAGARTVQVRLDWSDYEHWSRGRLTPSEVIRGVVACAASIVGADAIPERCDAAMLR